MLSFDSQTTVHSKALDGVSFTIRVLNRIQRAKRDLPLIEARTKYSQLWEQYEAIPKDAAPAEMLRKSVLLHELSIINDLHLKPAYIRAGLVSIAGLEIDGEDATADSLINSGSAKLDEFIDEIYEECQKTSGLDESQKKASEPQASSSEAKATDELTTVALVA
jgi:hypothetical protein